RYESGSLPSAVDAAQRSPTPEPWSSDPGTRRSRTCCGCCSALLGRSGVWQVASPAVAAGLGATRAGGSILSSPPVRELSSSCLCPGRLLPPPASGLPDQAPLIHSGQGIAGHLSGHRDAYRDRRHTASGGSLAWSTC